MNIPKTQDMAREAPHSGFFIEHLDSSNKALHLVSAINQILNRSSEYKTPSHSESDLAYLLKDSLNILAEEINLPFLLLGIQDDYSGKTMIIESSIATRTAGTGGLSRRSRKIQNIKYRHSYRPGEGIIGMVTEKQKPYFCPDIHKAPEFLNRTGLKEQFRNSKIGFLCLPIMQHHSTNRLKVRKQIIGTLSCGLFYSQDSFPGQRDQELAAYILDSPVFQGIPGLGYFLTIICDLLVHTVRLRIELERQQLERTNAVFRGRAVQNNYLQKIIGSSNTMQELFIQISQVARVNTTVLIRGESGTGKELVAQAIHEESTRAKKPFISVNCATLPEGMIDSELFGHVKGAFTGALKNHKGRFEQAEGGTLFLDEISELPLHLQSKLLRVLQEKEYQALGAELPRSADVRIIAASNHNLEQDIQERRFREDLFFRLSVFPIYLPPLRERKSDISQLLDHFLEKHAVRSGTSILRVADSALGPLMSYDWPGNVRELENLVERACILCEDGIIYAHHLPPSLNSKDSTNASPANTLKEAVERVEFGMLYQALKDYQGNLRLAAKQLDITERQIGLRMKRYDLEYKDFRG